MLKTLVNAFKNKDIRKKLLYTLMMLVVVRIGSLLPIPGVDTEYFSTLLSDITSGDMSYLNAFTGGSEALIRSYRANRPEAEARTLPSLSKKVNSTLASSAFF